MHHLREHNHPQQNIKDQILAIFNNKSKYKHIEDDRFTREKLTLDLVDILDKL